MLLLVEGASVVLLWDLSPTTKAGEAIFAIFLAIELVSLAMISNIYRSYKNRDDLSRGFLLVGCGLILVFVYASLTL